jgi:iron complex outermembrane recepter protein
MRFNSKVLYISTVTLFTTLTLIPGPGHRLWAQEKERLLFEDIPVVITASLKEQPITEAPTTITVITADDIRYSGATSIPDVLRQVAGVDVMSVSSRDQQVGVRGFIVPVNNKVLVLVDGRTVYTDLYGAVFWDFLPVGLQEIDRIEVVKSPSSSIYGANAYTGVINIITKSPEQLEGTTLHLSAGSRNAFIGSLLQAGVAKKIRYKVSAEWDRLDESSENGSPNGAGKIIRVNTYFAYITGKKSRLAFSAGRGHSQDRRFFSGEYIGTGFIDGRVDYFQLDAQYADWKFRTLYRTEKIGAQWPATGEQQTWNTTTFHGELLHSFKLGRSNSLVWGLNYRYNTVKKSPFIPQDQHQYLWAIFLEGDIKVTDRLRLTMGGRYDRHPLVGGHFFPRGNIFFSPSPHHIFRLSLAKAFRNPSFVDSYLYIERQLSLILPPPIPSMEIPFLFISQGNQNLKPEEISAYEIGYHFARSSHIALEINLFYNRYADFISLVHRETYYDANELFPGSPPGVFPKSIISTTENRGAARGVGGEISLDFLIKEGVTGFINYAYQKITDVEDDPVTPEINEKDRIRPENPKHKINAGLRFLFKNGLSINLLGHWVSLTCKFVRDSSGNSFLSPLKDYLLVDTRVGYSFWRKKAEVALVVTNLFNHWHFEYPSTVDSPLPNSVPVERRIIFTLGVKF